MLFDAAQPADSAARIVEVVVPAIVWLAIGTPFAIALAQFIRSRAEVASQSMPAAVARIEGRLSAIEHALSKIAPSTSRSDGISG